MYNSCTCSMYMQQTSTNVLVIFPASATHRREGGGGRGCLCSLVCKFSLLPSPPLPLPRGGSLCLPLPRGSPGHGTGFGGHLQLSPHPAATVQRHRPHPAQAGSRPLIGQRGAHQEAGPDRHTHSEGFIKGVSPYNCLVLHVGACMYCTGRYMYSSM